MRDVTLNGAGGRGAQRAVGERSAAVTGGAARVGTPDAELIERARRRRFSAEYKLGILKEAEACTQSGEIGALLCHEGLYTSHLSVWRKQRDEREIEWKDERRVATSLSCPACPASARSPKADKRYEQRQ
jgi:transposase-like protein